MPGRALYDNQMSIIAVNRIRCKHLIVNPTLKVSVLKNETVRIDMTVNANTIFRISELVYRVGNASTQGATSGNIQLDFSRGSDSFIMSFALHTISFDKDTYFVLREFKTNGTYAAPTLQPSTIAGFVDMLTEYVYDDESTLTLRITNNTNVDLVDLVFICNLVGYEETVS